ncbi:MAG TPA: hypothetical protein VKE98_24510 [Gemmataceae bacterium]|nr:hypothetical protein [Gemmataceae bacterium]
MIRRLLPLLSTLKPTRLGVLFAVLLGLGVGFWQWGRPPQPRVVLEKLGDCHLHAPVFSPDGRNLVTVQDPDADSLFVTLWDARTGKKGAAFLKGNPP